MSNSNSISKNSLSQARLKELLSYDPKTGVFTWIVGRNCVPKGSRAGCPDHNGYIKIKVQSHLYHASRLAWLYVNGKWPDGEIDHRDVDRSNNRLANLRDVTTAVNRQNQISPRVDNKLGVQGVYRHQDKFRAQVRLAGRVVFSKVYKDLDEASSAYLENKRRLHPGCTV